MKKGKLFKRLGIAFISVIIALSTFSCSASKPNGGYMGNGVTNEDINFGDNEDYTHIIENGFVDTRVNSTSYFSIDANTTSYPNLRSIIKNTSGKVDKDAVRVEEMLNYFNYNYETPTNGDILALNSSVFDNPYNSETKLMTIGLAAQKIDFSEIKNNLVFLIDVSGSMFGDDRLGLVQAAFGMLAHSLNPEDRISVVTYASGVKTLLDGAYGYEAKKITAVIEDLQAGGSTAGANGIQKAYDLAEKHFIEGGNNRVILATDGDFNVGISSIDGLKSFISEKRETGVYFSGFGVGRGNLKSTTLETLALSGNGTCSYLDSLSEAKRALVEELGGTLVTVAKDVKAGITFNSEYVESYRLIGYENKLLTEEEFEDSRTDAGELGSGHTVTVVYEIKLTDKEFDYTDKFATVNVRYKLTENSGADGETEEQVLLGVMMDDYHTEMTDNDAFVASVVEFALLLRESKYLGDGNFKSLIERLDSIDLEGDEFKYEFRQLVKDYCESRRIIVD